VLFEATGKYEVTEDAIPFITDNPYQASIIAKAYIINTSEAEQKTKLHLLFDHPALKPYTFKTAGEGMDWLMSQIK
jgi:hypothetical protein